MEDSADLFVVKFLYNHLIHTLFLRKILWFQLNLDYGWTLEKIMAVELDMNQAYTVLMLAFVGLVLTAQRAFATFPDTGCTVVKKTLDPNLIGSVEDCNGHLSTLVGVGSPSQVPPLNINITGNTTMVATPLNATSATNEHDYNIGFKIGYNDYNQSTTDEGLELGSYVSSNNDVDLCNEHTHAIRGEPHDSWHITNATACRDGYVGGWKSWCKSDGLDCAYWAAYGSVPSLVVLSVKVNHCVQGFCLDRQMLANVYHPPRMSPGVATYGSETNTNATGNQSQTNATTAGNLTKPAAGSGNKTTLFHLSPCCGMYHGQVPCPDNDCLEKCWTTTDP